MAFASPALTTRRTKVIGTPHNDRACLGPLTERILELVAEDEPSIVTDAERFSDLDELAAKLTGDSPGR